MNKIDRIEITDETGRVYVRHLSENEWLEYGLQDDNRTLKMFIDNGEVLSPFGDGNWDANIIHNDG